MIAIDSILPSVPNSDITVSRWHNTVISQTLFYQHCSHHIKQLKKIESTTFALYFTNRYEFMVTFVSLLYLNKSIIILPNILPETLHTLEQNTSIIGDSDSLLRLVIDTDPDPCEPVSAYDQRIFFLTSGSSGDPKFVEKNLDNLNAEAKTLNDLFGKTPCLHLASVSHQHIYGFLFACWWPLLFNHQIDDRHIDNPESYIHLAEKAHLKVRFISSPAFWKRFSKLYKGQSFHIAKIHQQFSSGGNLDEATQTTTTQILDSPIYEILGSTETGGVAQRNRLETEHWHTLPHVEIKIDADNQLWVHSPFINETDFISMSDRITLHDDGTFSLGERIDTIVKIEDKRISLSQIERSLNAHAFIEKVRCIKLTGYREFIGAIVILNQTGQALLKEQGKRALNKILSQHLQNNVDLIAIPKKWRFVEFLPENSQGKTTVADLEPLFDVDI